MVLNKTCQNSQLYDKSLRPKTLFGRDEFEEKLYKLICDNLLQVKKAFSQTEPIDR